MCVCLHTWDRHKNNCECTINACCSSWLAAIANTIELLIFKYLHYVNFLKYFDRCHSTNGAVFQVYELHIFVDTLYVLSSLSNIAFQRSKMIVAGIIRRAKLGC